MPVGRPAAAPAGFLDFCTRSPQDCAEPDGAVHDARSQAQQVFWASVFADVAHQPAAFNVPERSIRATGARRPAAAAVGYRTAPRRSARPPVSSVNTVDLRRSPDAALDVSSQGLKLSSQDWDRIDRTNRDLNRSIRRASDDRQYGVGDYWAIPGGRAPRGDCEDYVLAKRRALIAMGYPQTAFSIALVVTPWNEDHAVLLMATSEGEVVLVNLEQRMVRWDQTDYRWVKRQTPGRSYAWSNIG